ncbi:uncharacterized protein PHALS_02397 [Plasmopara halstedii]|uniref:Uncharacterized protein n=1 Tax=Plasmopara halstedii TaxID=4781 RepID=A0A0N7L748_PLAHL|nr:uncharacterized protein PHALS_02397 [Plasmopara halstedii]CEG46075.1 hypothetical protein PHALS_02397 [Plasmopara halstedii]|eukprot:XP_024582444.1 hypothetical protein PHALS_02397 [Plasmopara halstedii]
MKSSSQKTVVLFEARYDMDTGKVVDDHNKPSSEVLDVDSGKGKRHLLLELG